MIRIDVAGLPSQHSTNIQANLACHDGYGRTELITAYHRVELRRARVLVQAMSDSFSLETHVPRENRRFVSYVNVSHVMKCMYVHDESHLAGQYPST